MPTPTASATPTPPLMPFMGDYANCEQTARGEKTQRVLPGKVQDALDRGFFTLGAWEAQ